MTRATGFLRFLLVLLIVVVVVVCAALYAISLESASAWPELASLRLPLYVVVVAAFVPVVLAIASVFDFLGAVDDDAAFSDRTIEVLRRLRLLAGVFAGYLCIVFAGFWIATGLMHPTLVFLWFAAEVAALFVFTMVALLERIFVVASELRQDSELTV